MFIPGHPTESGRPNVEGVATPVAETAPAASPESAQPAPSESLAPSEIFAFSKIFEGQSFDSDEVSNEPPAASDEDADEDDEPEGSQPAPEGVSEPATPDSTGSEPEAPPVKPLSRRERERQERDDRIAALEAENARYTSAEYRQQVRAEAEAEAARNAQATVDEDFLGNQAEFERLKSQPYLSLPWTEQQWLDLREQRRAQFPTVERHFRQIYDQKLAELQTWATAQVQQQNEAGWNRVMSDLSDQIAASTKLPGVDAAYFKKQGVGWQQMAEHIAERAYAAGAAAKEAELGARVTTAESEAARNAQQLADKGADRLAQRRAPANVGRSAGTPSAPTFDRSKGVGGNLAAAFA